MNTLTLLFYFTIIGRTDDDIFHYRTIRNEWLHSDDKSALVLDDII